MEINVSVILDVDLQSSTLPEKVKKAIAQGTNDDICNAAAMSAKGIVEKVLCDHFSEDESINVGFVTARAII